MERVSDRKGTEGVSRVGGGGCWECLLLHLVAGSMGAFSLGPFSVLIHAFCCVFLHNKCSRLSTLVHAVPSTSLPLLS